MLLLLPVATACHNALTYIQDNPDPALLAQELRNLAGNNVNLGLWCTKGQRTKSIWITIPAAGSPIGLSLQWAPLTSTEEVWHVLDVAPNSPADLAGLLPYGDYIIGSSEGLVRGENGLGELIEHVSWAFPVQRSEQLNSVADMQLTAIASVS